MADNELVFNDEIIKNIKIKDNDINDEEDTVTDVDMSNVKTTVNVTIYRLGVPIRYYFDLDSGKLLFSTGNYKNKDPDALCDSEINLINIDNCIPYLNYNYNLPLHSFLIEVRSKLLKYDCIFENNGEDGAMGEYTIPRDYHTEHLTLNVPIYINGFNIMSYIRMMIKKVESQPHEEVDKLIGVEPYE
jgi:hypothetical protein